MKRTDKILVEFYDTECIENIVTLLYGDTYAKVVYVYFEAANIPTPEDRDALKGYVRSNFNTAVEFLEVRDNTLECALKIFRKLTGDGKTYDFDITGGSSVFIAAAGALAAGDTQGRIALHECDPRTGRFTFRFPETDAPRQGEQKGLLTAENLFALRGCRVLYPERKIRYRLDRDDLRGEIIRLWEVVRREMKAWNTFTVLSTRMVWESDAFRAEKKLSAKQRAICRPLLEKLQEREIITDLREAEHKGGAVITYRLHVPQSAAFLYDKGGNILEMMTYAAAMDCGCFRDGCTGVSLDWSEKKKSVSANPYNELDVVLMRGHIPCFVSCKSAEVENDYLYEIMIMARHYGGRYAVPALITATSCNAYLHARAREMGIVLIDDAGEWDAGRFTWNLERALTGK